LIFVFRSGRSIRNERSRRRRDAPRAHLFFSCFSSRDQQDPKQTKQQELFENRYWCQEQKAEYFSWAKPLEESPSVLRMRPLARELGVVLPVSFFERRGQAYFNSCAVIDVDGAVLGVYRKSHIPDGPGYQEKFYFSPGDTGFLVFETRHATIGVGICWDQWFPEAARCLALGVRFWLFFCFSAAVRPSFVLYLGGGGGRGGRPSGGGRILAGGGG